MANMIFIDMPAGVGFSYAKTGEASRSSYSLLALHESRIYVNPLKNMKKPRQSPRGVLVGPKVGFKPVKQVYRQVSKKNNVNSSGKRKDAEPTIGVSNSNPSDVLNSVENDVDLGRNGRASSLASKKANFSGSSFWNVKSSSTSTTPIVEKNDKIERLIIDEKVTLVDDEGKLFAKVDSSVDHDSKDEVASVDNEVTNSV
nr:peptidase S10, serine carboxypeptidase, alpha/beta hydrolase fold protein [Tanacetum cinerariifolium]